MTGYSSAGSQGGEGVASTNRHVHELGQDKICSPHFAYRLPKV